MYDTQKLIEIYENLKKKNIENPCVIFDIDDTLIDIHGHGIDSIIDFYNYILNDKYCSIILITARPYFVENVNSTMRQLDFLNIKNYLMIFFLKKIDSNIAKFKLNSRKKIKDLGYNCLLSIGDKEWDIGEYGGFGILLD